MTTRKYEQGVRAEHAELTRRRIIDALADLIRADPASPVAIEAVAEDAGVARSTIYSVFGSRAGLFQALAHDLAEHSGYERLLEATGNPDPPTALRGGLRVTVEMYAAERDILRALYSMQELDPDAIGGGMEPTNEERTRGMAKIARRLARGGHLRAGVTAARAADLLWVLTSFDAFDLLYTRRGLDVEAIAGLWLEVAERTLLSGN